MKTVKQLLSELTKEREKFTKENKPKMKAIVDELIARGVYPKRKDALTMVECYGADWYKYRSPLKCPLCKSNLKDLDHGPPFKREIGMYDRDLDRTVAYKCPDCQGTWPRK